LRIKQGNPRIDFVGPGIFFSGVTMHLYWRIKEELGYLGEVLIFHDPSLIRAYRRWIKKNSRALAYLYEPEKPSPHRFSRLFSVLLSLN
jgi:hypothetical protein